MAPKKNDLAAKKAAKEKKMLAVLGVVFLIVIVVFVLPLMKGESPTASAAPGTDPAVTTPLTATPTTTTVTPTGSVSSPGYSFTAGVSQLKALDGELKSKDPFAGAPAVTTESLSPPVPLIDEGVPSDPSDPSAPFDPNNPNSGAPGSTTPTASPFIYAVVSVNGLVETVALNAPFPAASPLFVLKSLKANGITFSLGVGSFANGAKTLALAKGAKLTLTNTADGSRYVVRLLSVLRTAPTTPAVPTDSSTGVLVDPPGGGTSTTPVATDPPPPTTPTSTTATTTG
jgi:hypothetical protein